MVVDTIKENLRINKKVATKKEIIFVEGDVIVPDAKPDVLNVICTSGVVSVYKKEIIDEKIKMEGQIDTYIMYMSDDNQGNIRGINTSLELSEVINISNITSEMKSNINSKIKEIEAKVVNERKISIKATLEISIEFFSEENISIINNLESENEIKMLQEELAVNSLVGEGETKIFTKDNIAIDNADNLIEILKVDMNICNKDIKISYNKVLTKAEAEIKIIYLTEDNRINKTISKIPIIGFIDIPEVNEGNLCDSNYEIKNIMIKPNSTEEHSIYVEFEIGVNAVVYTQKTINIIQDIYSPCENIDFNKKTVRVISRKEQKVNTKEIKERIKIEELEDKDLIDVNIIPNMTKENIEGNQIQYSGELELRFMMMGNDMQMVTTRKNISFEYNVENVSDIDNTNVKSNIEITNQDFVIQDNGEILVNVKMIFYTNIEKNASINTIDEIEVNGEREEQDYSLIMYIVKKGDSLWKIAKKYGSTIEDIVNLNGIEDPEVISPGQKIFIPRYRRNKISKQQQSMVNYG